MSLSAEQATLIAALLAGLISLYSLFMSFRVMDRKDRSLLLWEREIQRLIELEETVARIKHIACGMTARWSDSTGAENFKRMNEKFGELHLEYALIIGRYGRYPDLIVAANRVVNHSDSVMEKKREGRAAEELEERTEELFRVFLGLIDAETHRNEIFSKSRGA